MNKIRKLCIIIFLFIGAVGCSSAGEGEDVAVTPLDRSTWPTLAPTEARPTSTPFPLVDAAVLEAQRAEEGASLAAGLQSTEVAAVQIEPVATPTLPPPTPTLSSTPTPESTPTAEPTEVLPVTGAVRSFALNLRVSPGLSTEVVQVLNRGDMLSILAIDSNSGWVNVQTDDGLTGWVNPKYLTLNGDLNGLQSVQPTSNSNLNVPPSNQPVAANSQPGNASSSGGRLLIQTRSGQDIVVINRDGTGLRRLTTGIDPVLSPDGTKVAFTRWSGTDQGSLWVINTDGTGERAILGGINQVKSPSWSPDSKRIAVNFQRGGTLTPTRKCWDLSKGEPDINYWTAYDVELEYAELGGQQIPVRICWRLPPDPHWQLRVIDLEAQTFEDLPAGQYAFAPTWDPANSWRVVSVGRLGLVWTDISRGVAEALTNDPFDRAPVFSPDGKYIAVTYKQADHWEIHRLNSDGTGRVRLTKTPFYEVVTNGRHWNNASPTFSPDGSKIAFLTDRTGRWEVWVMNVDGSNQRPMFPPEINDQLEVAYEGNDARALGWGK